MTPSAAREPLVGALVGSLRADLIGPQPLYLTAFPDFDHALPVLPGFSDHSRRNDACPCMFNPDLQLMLWCDYANPSLREADVGSLYTLSETDKDGATVQHLFFTDDIRVIRVYLASPLVSSQATPHAGR